MGSTTLIVAMVAVVFVIAYTEAGNCPLPSKVYSCSPKCLQDYECGNGKVCCQNGCNAKSCTVPAASGTGTGGSNKYGGAVPLIVLVLAVVALSSSSDCPPKNQVVRGQECHQQYDCRKGKCCPNYLGKMSCVDWISIGHKKKRGAIYAERYIELTNPGDIIQESVEVSTENSETTPNDDDDDDGGFEK